VVESRLGACAQRKTALSASIAKNKPPKDQPNSRVVARSFMDQQRRGIVSPKGNGLRSIAFLPVTTLGGAPFRRNRGCVLLTLTQPLILRAISLPDVPFTLSLDNWLGGNPINQRRVITLLGAHDLGINVGRLDFKADIPKISWQPRLTV
jgi:hypothetical protein